ncbi:hypothetical protein LGZ99_04555 [Photorhabdus temperata]|uniref:Uncharacterized protein n=2 Tax=Photorhabdus temperata TaxID=574560 RepID=A0A081S143_PHOTE|nr:hypothetical protein [Photorhabdus temperata]KER04646.1 hypothetical protein MEG1DRAFT_00637 [Photorhabdus temperata subsp. temperata Meg1]MCT8346502.1 hypothetical protein [Photorhabdus temperata]
MKPALPDAVASLKITLPVIEGFIKAISTLPLTLAANNGSLLLKSHNIDEVLINILYKYSIVVISLTSNLW